MHHVWIYSHIGAAIRSRRKQLKLTQAKLAARLGVSRASLANIEVGRQNVLVHQIYMFAAALDLALTDLLPQGFRKSATSGELPLPSDLKPLQKDQIKRLIGGSQEHSN
jgi:transcriptional regulator with XRE-family HTH domain